MNRINKKNKKSKGNSIANYQLQKKEQAIEKKRIDRIFLNNR